MDKRIGDPPTCHPVLDARHVAQARIVLCDLDGCLISEGRAFDEAPDFVAGCGDRLWIVSNRSDMTAAALAVLRDCGAEAVVLAGFMRLLTPEFIAAFRYRILNIHPALLPNFPGAHAHRDALAAGVSESGCSAHLVDEGIDTGPVILQQPVEVLPDDTEESLAARILPHEHRLLPEAVRLLAAGRLEVDGGIVRILPEK